MGRVTVDAVVENLSDLWEAEAGRMGDGDVRRVTLSEALVDTGATMLSLPTKHIEALGLKRRKKRKVTTSAGVRDAAVYDAVRLTIEGRDCTVDVVEVADDVPALIGQVPLELLDFVVDPQSRKLIGNPAHNGEHIIEMY